MSDGTLFSLQGEILTADILSDGSIGKLRWVGNVPEATLQLNVESTDKTESYTGQRLQIGRLQTGLTSSLNYTMDEWSATNLASAFNSEKTVIAASTVTGETFPTGLAVGDLVRLDHPFVTSLAITDSAGTPATVAGSNYVLQGHCDNVVKIAGLGAYVQPFKAAYSYAAVDNLVLFSKIGKAVYMQFNGVNTETGDPVLLDLWRVRHDPIKELALINKEYGKGPLRQRGQDRGARRVCAAVQSGLFVCGGR